MSGPNSTHFGYQEIPWNEKVTKVGEVFTSVAERYDVMNDLMSFGIHRLWKRYAIALSAPRKGQCILDLAGGTGDLTWHYYQKVGPTGTIILADINNAMLQVGRNRFLNEGKVGINYLQVNAESLPFEENSFDCVCIAFGLRNVTDKDAALRSIYSVLKPGGRVVILEFSKPILPFLQKIYDAYSFSVLPKLGDIVTNDAKSYQYLAESIRMHPDQETLKKMLECAEFEAVDYFNLTAGIVAIHRGFKF